MSNRIGHLLRVFLPFALGYFLSYLYRTVNAIIAPDLVRDIGLDPASLGLLTSVYLLAFGAFQLPLGILLDRFGARRVVIITDCCCRSLYFQPGDLSDRTDHWSCPDRLGGFCLPDGRFQSVRYLVSTRATAVGKRNPDDFRWPWCSGRDHPD